MVRHFFVLILTLTMLYSASGCSNNLNESITNKAEVSRLWLPTEGPLNWNSLFPTQDIRFTVSYSIESDGSISNLQVSNVTPLAKPNADAMEQLASSRFKPTPENLANTPVQISSQIELKSLNAPVLVSR